MSNNETIDENCSPEKKLSSSALSSAHCMAEVTH